MDFEVELCHYDARIEGTVNPTTGLLENGPDTRVCVLVTGEDDVAAENRAVTHLAAQMHPPVRWHRVDHINKEPHSSIHASWHNDTDERQIWLESSIPLPAGDEPGSWYPPIDIRDVKHPFIRPNREVARSNAAIGAFFGAIPSERGERVRALAARAQEAAGELVERLAESAENNPPRKAN
jgi:hypothetical protein